ncbi:hypothetical protein [Micromonospora sp. NBC_01796]|uniref:hypothetical protein n=1 Tax=Micromonospora sp. NBC_01796 TaxID=2975987 RepID=UPI002DD83570|nr:hypothetical protein [Micromonospora sp. NBC_01796]WSA86453.1 hypothetical protein OIE47_02180 [Micromonospora sp. NBC_01796]
MTKSDRPRLVKITLNLTNAADTALTKFANDQDTNRTDAVNRAIRLAALLHDLAPGGQLTIAAPDGALTRIYLL